MTEAPVKRDHEPMSYPALSGTLTPPGSDSSAAPVIHETPDIAASEDPPARADDRPRLPRREPQQSLVAQLEDEPDDESQSMAPAGENRARTLSAFHKGTRRGRGRADDS